MNRSRSNSRGLRCTAVRRSAITTAVLAAGLQGTAWSEPVIWAGGSGSWFQPSHWIGSGPTSSTSDVFIDGGNAMPSVVTLNSSAVPVRSISIDIGDSLLLRSGGSVTILGPELMIAGELSIQGSRLRLASDTMLSGTGTTRLALNPGPNGAPGFIASADGAVHKLTIGAGHTLRGAGVLGDYAGSGNRGLSVTNLGTLIVEGGRLTAYEAFDNSAGQVQIANGAELYLIGAVFSGGTITGSGSILGGTYADVTFSGSIKARSLYLQGSIAGELIVPEGSSLSLAGDTTFSGAGTTTWLGDRSYSTIYTNDRTARNLTIGAGHTLRGQGYLGGGFGTGNVNVVNQGTVAVDGYGGLAVTGNFDNSAGQVKLGNGNSLRVTGQFSGGTITAQGNIGLTGTYSNVTLAGDARIYGSIVSFSGALNGNLSLYDDNGMSASGLRLVGDVALTGTGVTRLNGTRSLISADSTSRNLGVGSGHMLRGNGYLGADGTANSANALNIVNQGAVVAERTPQEAGTSAPVDTSLQVTGTFTQHASGMLRLFVGGHDAAQGGTTGKTGGSYSQLFVNEAVLLDGELQIVLQPEVFAGHYVPAVGDTFDFVVSDKVITVASTLRYEIFITEAGLNYADDLTLTKYQSRFQGDSDSLYRIGENLFSFAVVNGGHVLRGTLVEPLTQVPEPGTWALWLGGIAAIGSVMRRRRAAAGAQRA